MGRRTRNPKVDELQGAEEVAEGWRGRKPREVVEVEEQEEWRENLVCLGELEELEILNEKVWFEEGDLETFSFSRKKRDLVWLAGTQDRAQLLFVGGDQEIPEGVVKKLGGSGARKDKVSLGYIYSVTYWADKHHLQGSNGKVEAYMHCFGEQSFPNPGQRQDGRADYEVWMPEQKLSAGVLPQLVYDRLNKKLEIVGGKYEIRDEGVWD